MKEQVPVPEPADFREAAAVQRAMFLAYLEAGFTEDQAIKFISRLLVNNMPPVPSMNGQAGEE